jgi:hypothetical protein
MAEIIICANCKRQLQVPDQYLGQTVQCPECGNRFVASASAVSVAPAPPPAGPDSRGTARPPRYDDDDDTRPRRRRFDDDDDDDFDLPRVRHDHAPHRGGLIMALGLVSLFGGLLFTVLGPFAWFMGTKDLREIHAGRMDPAGESMTRAGQVCGIISSLILGGIVLLVFYFILAEAGRF